MTKLISIFILLFSPLLFSEPSCNGKEIYGRSEEVLILDNNLILKAKMDTGAAMSSLSAKEIKITRRGLINQVEFTIYIPNENKRINFTLPLVKIIKVLNRKEENKIKMYSERPVVNLSICIGTHKEKIRVNLIDRTDFRYPMLIGADALNTFKALVDVSQENMNKLQCSG